MQFQVKIWRDWSDSEVSAEYEVCAINHRDAALDVLRENGWLRADWVSVRALDGSGSVVEFLDPAMRGSQLVFETYYGLCTWEEKGGSNV